VSSRPFFRLATKGHALDVLGRVGMRGNKTHLVFRDKVGTKDRDLPGELSKRVPVIGGRRFRRAVATL
jgi:hypothetical protein